MLLLALCCDAELFSLHEKSINLCLRKIVSSDHNFSICRFPLNSLSNYFLIHIAEFGGFSFFTLCLDSIPLHTHIVPEVMLDFF